MFTMIASAVICGCGHEVQADTDTKSHHTQEAVSHTHDGGGQQAAQGDHHDKGSTLAQDCQPTDMQILAHFDISKPDLKNSLHLDYAINEEIPSWSLNLVNDRGIRGPPPWDEPSQTKPSILLTTQRLRI